MDHATGAHVLIIDDEPVTLALMRSLVSKAGHRVTTAAAGADGYRLLLSDSSIELVLVDWMLSDIPGPEVISRARKECPARTFYSVLVTGKSESEDVAHGIAQGADAYLKKPVNNQELLAYIEAGLRVVRLQQSLLSKQEEIARLHMRTTRLLGSIPTFYLSLDRHDVVRDWNSAAERTFSISSADAIGRSLFKLGLQLSWERLLTAIAAARDKRQDTRLVELPYKNHDGEVRYLDMAIAPIRGDECEEEGTLLMGEDITARVQIATQLQHAQKLESLGQLASGLAHEINSPMQFIGDNVRFVKGAFKRVEPLLSLISKKQIETAPDCPILITPDERRELVERAKIDFLLAEGDVTLSQTLEGAQRVTDIVKAMREFSHPGVAHPVSGDLNHIVENAVTVSRNEWKGVATIIREYDEALPPFHGYPAEFGQAVLNMIVNAAHAISEKGASPGEIRLKTAHADGVFRVQISDSGCGIPKSYAHRIFDPFFTTKPVGRGTGQGLSIAHSMITKLHGGSIQFHSIEGSGTTFVIEIPDTPPGAEQGADSIKEISAPIT